MTDKENKRDHKLIALTVALMNGKHVNTKDVAEEFEISVVTAWRWIKAVSQHTSLINDGCGNWYVERTRPKIEYFK